MDEAKEGQEAMSEVRSLVETFGFRLVRGAGGAEQFRRYSSRVLPLWLVLTTENDTLSVPTSLDEPVNLAVFRRDPEDQRSDPEKELVFPDTQAALVHVLRFFIW